MEYRVRKTPFRNARLFAVNNGPGFDIFLDLSGQRRFVVHHRHNGLLYKALHNGVRVDDLRRRRLRNPLLESMVRHLLNVVDSEFPADMSGGSRRRRCDENAFVA